MFTTIATLVGAVVILKFLYDLGYFIYRLFLRPVVPPTSFGSWAVVTGCTDGIGEAYVIELAKKGVNIFLISRSQEKLDKVVQDVAKFSVQTKTMVVDFEKADKATFKRIQEATDPLDVGILVNNVGTSYDHCEFFEAVPEEWIDRVIKINITATTYMTKYLLPAMVKRGRGAIINISSMSGVGVAPMLTSYGASKSYVDTFSRMLAIEYKSKNIFVQSITPAFVISKMSGFKRPALTIPRADIFVKSALRTLGYETSISGFWVHDLLRAAQSFAPDSLLGPSVLKAHISLKKRYLAKYKKTDN